MTMRDSVKYKLMEAGKKRPVVEGFAGDDFHRQSGRWCKKKRVIDRQNDRYLEEVVDPDTGAVVHYCDEPLSRHQGHGDAKKPSPSE